MHTTVTYNMAATNIIIDRVEFSGVSARVSRSGAGGESACQSWGIERNNRCPCTVGGLTTVTGDRAVERAASASQRASVSAQVHGDDSIDFFKKAFNSNDNDIIWQQTFVDSAKFF